MRGAQFPDYRCCKYSTWLAFALFDYRRRFQHWRWRRSAGPQQREFQHGSGRCGVVAQIATGNFNPAVGTAALLDNTSSFDNTAIGYQALTQTTGGANTAVGRGALDQNVTGNFNTAIGKDAGGLATGSGNVYIGHLIAGVAGENNHTYIRNIKDTSVSGGGADIVTIDLTTGLLGHAVLLAPL